MSQAYNGIIARDDYAIAQQIFTTIAGFDPNKTRITPGSIRLEQPLVANQNLYQFPALINIQNQNGPFNTEIRLQQQDSIVVTQLGIFLANPASTTDTAFRLFTYPNTIAFPVGAAGAGPLNSLYQNGRLRIEIDNNVWIKQWDMMRHYKTSQTQQTAPLGANSPLDQLDGVEDGYYPMQPFLILTGAQDINISINMNQSAPSAVDANSRIVMIMRGFVAQMSTVIQ